MEIIVHNMCKGSVCTGLSPRISCSSRRNLSCRSHTGPHQHPWHACIWKVAGIQTSMHQGKQCIAVISTLTSAGSSVWAGSTSPKSRLCPLKAEKEGQAIIFLDFKFSYFSASGIFLSGKEKSKRVTKTGADADLC